MAELAVDIKINEDRAVAAAKNLGSAFEDTATDMERLVAAGQDLSKSNDEIARDLAKVSGRPYEEVRRDVDRAEAALRDLGRTGTDSARDVQREVEEASDDLDRMGRAARDAGNDGNAGLGRIKSGAKEVQQELGQNLGETVSSIRGDFSDLGQVGQDTLGGLAASVAGMGPAGLLGAFALAAGAIGLGAITAGQEEAKQKQEDLNRAAADWASAYEESAGRIVSAAYIVGDILAQSTDPERNREATEAAKEWGVDVPTAMRAIAGDATALVLVQESLARRTKEANDEMSEAERNVGKLGDGYSSLPADIQKGQERLDELTGSMQRGQQQAQNAATALYDYAVSTGVATGKTDDLGNSIVQLPGGKEIVVDAKTQTAYEDIAAFEARQIADKNAAVIVNLQDNTASQMDRIVSNLRGRSVTVGVGTVLKPGWE